MSTRNLVGSMLASVHLPTLPSLRLDPQVTALRRVVAVQVWLLTGAQAMSYDVVADVNIMRTKVEARVLTLRNTVRMMMP